MLISSKLNRKHKQSSGVFRILAGACFVLSTATFSYAQQPPPKGERRGPPPEAFKACEQSKLDDVCTVTTKRGTITGTCKADRRRTEVLLCVPDNHAEGKRRKGEKPNKNDDESISK